MDEKTCFIIAPIGEPKTDVRKRSDQIFDYLIVPALKELGYIPERSDRVPDPGIITTQIIQSLVEAPLVIADLTDHNPNVFYELAVRHAVGKPVIQMIQKGQKLPFDVAGNRTIIVDYPDLGGVAEAQKELEKQARAVLTPKEGRRSDNPISIAIDLHALERSSDPEARSLADIISTMNELKTEVDSIARRLERPDDLIPANYLESALGIAIQRTNQKASRLFGLELVYEIEAFLAGIFESLDRIKDITRSKEILRELDAIELKTSALRDVARGIVS